MRGCGLLVGAASALALAGALAPAPALAGRDQALALTATRAVAVAFDDEADCASVVGGRRVELSSDRGATWQRTGPCLGDASALLVDPLRDLVVVGHQQGYDPFTSPFGESTHAVRFSSTGFVDEVALPAGASHPGALLDGDLYVSLAGAIARVDLDDGSAATCAALPLPAGSGLDPAAAAAYAVSNAAATRHGLIVSGQSGDPAEYVTLDRCASWTRLALSVEAPRPLTAGPHDVLLFAETPLLFDLRTPTPGALRPAGPVQVPGAPPIMLDADGSVVVGDTLSHPLLPGGWPAAPPPASPGMLADPVAGAPSSTAAAALEHLNARYRRPAGIPDLAHVPALQLAAERHAGYVAVAGYATGHSESQGQPGFSGANPEDRCKTAGWPICGEVLDAHASGPVAIDEWLATPFHGLPLLTWDHAGFGAATGPQGEAAVIDGALSTDLSEGLGLVERTDPAGTRYTAAQAYGVPTFLAARRAATTAALAGQPLRTWPADGTQDVFVTWAGAELPDPLAGLAVDPAGVGPVLFLLGGGAGRTARLEGPEGPIRLIEPASLSFFGHGARIVDSTAEDAFFAATRLRPLTAYVLHVTLGDGTTRDARFRTNDGTVTWRAARTTSPPPPPPPVPGPTTTQPSVATRCRPTVARTVVRKGIRVTLRLGKTCAGGALQRRVGRAWKPVRGPVVVPVGATIRWRVVVAGAVVVRGSLVATRPPR